MGSTGMPAGPVGVAGRAGPGRPRLRVDIVGSGETAASCTGSRARH